MAKNLFNIDSLSKQQESIIQSVASKEALSMSLPFIINALLVCDDAQVEDAVKGLLNGIKNLELSIEKKLAFITQEYQIAMVVYTGNESLTISDVEKISNADTKIILIGDNLPQTLLRKSIQLSISDFVPLETAELELLPAIQTVVKQLTNQVRLAPMVSIINGKAGSGTSFITNVIGQLISDNSDMEIALFDADLQYGTLSDSLNFKPEYFLDDAIAEVKDLDATAIKTMMSKRKNLSLLPVKAYSRLNRLAHIDQNKISQLLGKLRLNYHLLVADLSRGLEPLSIPIIESSEHILIVVQQNVVSLREAKALVEQLRNIMGINTDKIHILVNRFSEKFSTISIEDVQKTTKIESVFSICNDYQLASACTDLGKSMRELSDSKHIADDLKNIIEHVIPLDIEFNKKSNSFWSRITGKK